MFMVLVKSKVVDLQFYNDILFLNMYHVLDHLDSCFQGLMKLENPSAVWEEMETRGKMDVK